MIDKDNDITKGVNEHIRNMFAFLDEQEKDLEKELEKGKQKEEDLHRQLTALKKKIEQISNKVLSGGEQNEIVNNMDNTLSDDEKKDIQNEFGDKSLAEIEQEIKKNPTKRQRMKKKIWIPLMGVGVASALTFAIYAYTQYQKKNKQKQDMEQIVVPGDNIDNTAVIIPPARIEADIDSLKAKISDKQISISYKELVDSINNIQNDEIRKELIGYLHQGKIIEAQEMFGMKKDSEYPSNKATGKIDRNTLERFSSPYFGLYGIDLLDNKDIPHDVKDAYLKFLLGTFKNNGKEYLIISKTDFHIYLFTKDHVLEYRTFQANLFGEDIDKIGKRLPYTYYKTNRGWIYHNHPVNTDTPEGMFRFDKVKNKTSNFISDGPKVGLVLIPIDTLTQEIDHYRYEKIKINGKMISTIGIYDMEIHPVYQPPKDRDKYENAMETPKIEDNNVSHGCINTSEIGFFADNLPIGSIVYITHK